MSATFADDSVLITDFDADPVEITSALAPSSASDLGDRMILVPQELDPQITDEEIKSLVIEKAKIHNAVVIVPSHFRAEFWKDAAALTLTADDLESGIKQLKAGHVGLTIIVNKYDGIDLPGHACRLLVLDGVPTARRMIDNIEQWQLNGTQLQTAKPIQQIEQGMGRGVRASDDYCVVLLMGRSLTSQLFTNNGISHFTSATRIQFELSENVVEQVRNKGIAEIGPTIDYCLNRDSSWVKLAKGSLAHVKYETESSDVSIPVARRAAFDAASAGDLPAAIAAIQGQVNATSAADAPGIRGWLMAELAEYTYPLSAVESQQIMKSANELNRQLLRPTLGIDYRRLPALAGEQAIQSLNYLRTHFKAPNELIIAAHAIADDLAFRPESYRRFHNAMRDAACVIGFSAQLPESECGSGPDVLWAVGGLRYFIRV